MGNAISAFKVKQTSWVALQKSGIKLYAYHSRKVHVYTTCCTDADQDQKIEMDIHKIWGKLQILHEIPEKNHKKKPFLTCVEGSQTWKNG